MIEIGFDLVPEIVQLPGVIPVHFRDPSCLLYLDRSEL